MTNPNRFYVYAFLRKDRTPYYIGKGSGLRAWKNRRGKIHKPKEKDRILIIWRNLSEQEALAHEIRYIAAFGRKDLGTGILYNRTDGGDGTSRRSTSEEARNNYRKANLGENNPVFGNSWWYNPDTEEEKHFKGFPGDGWVKGRKPISDETREKLVISHLGHIPGEEARRRQGEARKGKKWWVNAAGECRRKKECPGVGWQSGRKWKTGFT
jgi:hypothetical protein